MVVLARLRWVGARARVVPWFQVEGVPRRVERHAASHVDAGARSRHAALPGEHRLRPEHSSRARNEHTGPTVDFMVPDRRLGASSCWLLSGRSGVLRGRSGCWCAARSDRRGVPDRCCLSAGSPGGAVIGPARCDRSWEPAIRGWACADANDEATAMRWGRSDLRRPAQGSDLCSRADESSSYLGRVISNTMNFNVGVAATISCGTFSGMSRKSPGPTR